MNSKIIKSTIYHQRLGEVSNTFSYKVLMFLIDVSELNELNNTLKLFSYNKIGVFKFSDSDFLHKNKLNVHKKIINFLSTNKVTKPVCKIYSLTTIRFLNHTFNPITIYYIIDEHESLICHVAEVNNTFGEGHIYFLNHNISDDDDFYVYETIKNFRVSPLYDVSGYYQFRISKNFTDNLSVHIDLIQNDELVFKSGFKGVPYEFEDSNLLKFIYKMPFNTFLTIPRILFQAGKLHFLHKIPFASKHYKKHKETYESSYPPYIKIL